VACVRAELNSATGKPRGPQTYPITIDDGAILDRRRTDQNDTRLAEHFEPI
jgi:hypothetical protein